MLTLNDSIKYLKGACSVFFTEQTALCHFSLNLSVIGTVCPLMSFE